MIGFNSFVKSLREYCVVIGRFKFIKSELIVFFSGEVARLKSYITQRPPFDVKNPLMAEIKINRNIHKVLFTQHSANFSF